MIILSWITGLVGAFFLVLAAIAFFRSKDVFVMLHIVAISNFYIIPLNFISVELERFSWISFIKIAVIILLNILTAHLLNYVIAKKAIANQILPDADFQNLGNFLQEKKRHY